MTTSSTDPNVDILTTNSVMVPFTVVLQISTSGLSGLNRWEKNAFYIKTANRLETLLNADVINQDYGIEYSFPVKYAPKLGIYGARLLINGNLKESKTTFTETPAADTNYINTGVILNGYGITNNGNRVPDPQIDAIAKLLHDNFSIFITDLDILDSFNDPVLSIYWIDVCQIRYGYNGRSIQ